MSRPVLTVLALAASLGALAGCAEQATPVSGSRVYYGDLQGMAKICTVPQNLALTAGEQTETTMLVGNDGGWCGITLANRGRAFDAGLLVGRPEHGRVHVHKIGDATRVDYTPDAGYGGPDRFTVRFLPGNPAIRVNVTVEGGAPPPPPAPTAAPARTAPAKPAAKKK